MLGQASRPSTLTCLLCCRLCTWLSFDGGFSWTDIAEGTWIYEYADWGGLVVMSKHELNGPADEVRTIRLAWFDTRAILQDACKQFCTLMTIVALLPSCIFHSCCVQTPARLWR